MLTNWVNLQQSTSGPQDAKKGDAGVLLPKRSHKDHLPNVLLLHLNSRITYIALPNILHSRLQASSLQDAMDSNTWEEYWKPSAWPHTTTRPLAYDHVAAYPPDEVCGLIMPMMADSYMANLGYYPQFNHNAAPVFPMQQATPPWTQSYFDGWQTVQSPFTESTAMTQTQDNPDSAVTTPLHSPTIFDMTKEERNTSEENHKKRKRFSEDQCKILEAWFQENYHRPIISAQEKSKLSEMTGMTVVQVNDWLSRKRKRLAAISKKATTGVSEEALPSESSSNFQPNFEEDWRSDLGLCSACEIPSSLLLKFQASSTEWWFNTLSVSASKVDGNGREGQTCRCFTNGA